VPSTPSDPSQAVIQGLDECLGEDAPLLRRLFHGSTVATNAVLERKGGRTALVTTRGFKDILVLQRQTRPDVNSIVCRKPEPLVPLRRTVEATERVSVRGEVIVPLGERGFVEALDRLVDSDFEPTSFKRTRSERISGMSGSGSFHAPSLSKPVTSTQRPVFPAGAI
jgi:N-methylhydantoinase A